MCENCFVKVDEIAQFREICAATNSKMMETKRRQNCIGAINTGHHELNGMSDGGIITENEFVSLNVVTSLIDYKIDSKNERAKIRPGESYERQIGSAGNSSPIVEGVATAKRKLIDMDSDLLFTWVDTDWVIQS